MPIQVYSEIAPLRRVLLHRPAKSWSIWYLALWSDCFLTTSPI